MWWGGINWNSFASGEVLAAGSCKHGNELPGSLKYWKILE
jgi:hypothetical protein